MMCEAPRLSVATSWWEMSKDNLSDKETHVSTASTDDVATDCLTDDEAPPMLTLERSTTLTVYSEMSSNEWQPPAIGVPDPQSAAYMVPPPCFPAPLSAPDDVGSQSVADGDYRAQSFASSFESSQVFDQWDYERSQTLQFESSFQEEFVTWPAKDGYLVQDNDALFAQLLASGEQRRQVIVAIKGQVARLSFQQSGCRIVQYAIDTVGHNEVGEIINELQGYVYKAARSPFANYVIQKVVTMLPPSLCSFVADELRGVAGVVARNKYGCRILCRIFERLAAEPGSRELAHELFAEAAVLSRHVFAHHVMEIILEHGLLEDRQTIARALLPQFWYNAEDRYSSYVLASALIRCAEEEVQALVAVISAGSSEKLASLGRGQAGNRVLKALPKMPAHLSKDALQTVVAKLRSFESAHADNRHGKRLLQELNMAAQAAVAA